MLAIRRELLEQLLDSDPWRKRLEEAETLPHISAVLQAFCEEKERERVVDEAGCCVLHEAR